MYPNDALALTVPLTVVVAADLTPLMVGGMAGAVSLGGIYLSHRLASKKIAEIHVLVNSRLTEALNEISDLKTIVARKDSVIQEQAEEKELRRK